MHRTLTSDKNKIMNNKYQSYLIITLFSIIFLSALGSLDLKAQEYKNDSYISRFDADIMSKKYLKDFELVRKRASWNYGRVFVYRNSKANECIFITIGLHSSADAANNIANNYLNEISVRMSSGQYDKKLLGDKFWYLTSSNDSNSITNIVFLRKNALLILSCSPTFRELFQLAKKIDEGITNGDSFVNMNLKIETPVIETFEVIKEMVKPNDFAKIRIKGAGVNNEPLEFQFFPGLMKNNVDSENVFTFESSLNFTDKSSGMQVIKAIAISESNVVSPVVELKIKTF